MPRLRPFLLACSLLTAASLFALWQGRSGDAAADDTERVSVDGSENEATGGDSEDAAISADGRFVAFPSGATDLVTGDNNSVSDVFVRDRQDGTTERVSVDSSGTEADQHSGEVDISADGRYVVFVSSANNLVPNDNDNDGDVFVHDRQTGATEIVSVDSSGNYGDANSYGPPSISGDGRYVAFHSSAENLVGSDGNGVIDVFVHDRQTGATEIISVNSSGDQGTGAASSASITPDGRYVAFDTRSALVANDTGDDVDVFVRDRQNDTTEIVSVDSSGNHGSDSSFYAHLSSDGRYVAFESRATNLVPGVDTNADEEDIYVHDRQTGQTERVSVDNNGDQGSASSEQSGISGDGRYVVFGTRSSLVTDDGNGFEDVYVRDRQLNVTQRVSDDTGGNDGNGDSWGSESDGSISADGRYIAFISDASDLVAGDGNGVRDVFVYDQGAPPTPTPTPTPTPSPTPTATPGPPCPGATAPPGGTCPPCPGFEPAGVGIASTCPPTPSPSPTPTATPTPTPSPSPSPTGTLPPVVLQGDVDCNGQVNAADTGDIIRFRATHGDEEEFPPCDVARVAGDVGGHPWGDVNCDGTADVLDALAILVYAAAAGLRPAPTGCVPIGEPLGV